MKKKEGGSCVMKERVTSPELLSARHLPKTAFDLMAMRQRCGQCKQYEHIEYCTACRLFFCSKCKCDDLRKHVT